MIKLFMTSKGFTDNQSNIETPNDIGVPEKPLKTESLRPSRVDTVSYTHLTLPTKRIV